MIKTHTLFRDATESILKLNPIIHKDGYQFEKINMAQLSSLISFLLRAPEYSQEMIKHLDGSIVSMEFVKAYGRSRINNDQLMSDEKPYYIILTAEQEFENADDKDGLSKALNKVRDYSNILLKKLHLLKSSSIEYVTTIQHPYGGQDYRAWTGNLDPERYFHNRLLITDEDLELAKEILSSDLYQGEYFQFALNEYEASYRSNNIRTCYLHLMTALEGLFNRGKSPIAHTIARHLSLILEPDAEKFECRYRELKKMYDLRSAIIHGASAVDYHKISSEFKSLREFVLRALQYVNRAQISKDELFIKMNASGFQVN